MNEYAKDALEMYIDVGRCWGGVGMDYLSIILLSFASVLCTCTFIYA